MVETGPFGRGGGQVLRVRMTFSGRLGPAFSAYVLNRADRLSLKLDIHCTDTEATLLIEGQDAMIGALEMAACIGPETCDVTHWNCVELTNSP